MVVNLKAGGYFKKVVIKTGLTVKTFQTKNCAKKMFHTYHFWKKGCQKTPQTHLKMLVKKLKNLVQSSFAKII